MNILCQLLITAILSASLYGVEIVTVDELHSYLLVKREKLWDEKVVDDAVAVELIPYFEKIVRGITEEQLGTKLLYCQVLGKTRSLKAVPTLMNLLSDKMRRILTAGGPDGHVEMSYQYVCLEADEALRKITKQTPIDRIGPGREGVSEEVLKKVQNAWLGWYENSPKN